MLFKQALQGPEVVRRHCYKVDGVDRRAFPCGLAPLSYDRMREGVIDAVGRKDVDAGSSESAAPHRDQGVNARRDVHVKHAVAIQIGLGYNCSRLHKTHRHGMGREGNFRRADEDRHASQKLTILGETHLERVDRAFLWPDSGDA
ncbi:MAG: hypothetical protein ABIP48_04325 [Planctomycetota bacterium]